VSSRRATTSYSTAQPRRVRGGAAMDLDALERRIRRLEDLEEIIVQRRNATQ